MAAIVLPLVWPDGASAQRATNAQLQTPQQSRTSSNRRTTPQNNRRQPRRGGLDNGNQPQIGPSGEGVDARGSFDEEGFIGRDAEDVRATFDRMSPRERRGNMFDMMFENLNEMRRSQERWQEQRRRPPPVRVRLQPVFSAPMPAPAVVEANLQARLRDALVAVDAEAEVELVEGVAVLRGDAATVRARKVAEQIVLLQPGVKRVENQMVVRQPATIPTTNDTANSQ